MNTATRRIVAAVTLAAAPALIAVGVASAASAEPNVTDIGPSAGSQHGPNFTSPGTRATPWQPVFRHRYIIVG